MNNEKLKEKILELTREYSSRMHSMNKPGNDANHPFQNPAHLMKLMFPMQAEYSMKMRSLLPYLPL